MQCPVGDLSLFSADCGVPISRGPPRLEWGLAAGSGRATTTTDKLTGKIESASPRSPRGAEETARYIKWNRMFSKTRFAQQVNLVTRCKHFRSTLSSQIAPIIFSISLDGTVRVCASVLVQRACKTTTTMAPFELSQWT